MKVYGRRAAEVTATRNSAARHQKVKKFLQLELAAKKKMFAVD